MNYIILALSILLISCTLLSFIKHPSWVFRTWDFPRFQLFNLAFALLIIEFLFIDNSLHLALITRSILFTILAIQFYWILPYTFLHPKEVHITKSLDPEKQISILISNVYMENRKVDKLLGRIDFNTPDIIILLEGNKWWDDAVKGLDKHYPFSLKHPREDTYGMHLFSKLELRHTELKFLIESNVPSIHTEIKLRNGDWVKLFALHPSPPSPTQKDTSTERDAELILVAKLSKKEYLPVIVTGDLNDSAWSRTTVLFRKISQLLDPRIGRGRYSTFNAKIPFFQWPLDHIFHSKDFSLVNIKKVESIGSDHYPIYAKIQLDKKNSNKNADGLKANNEEKKIAQEIILEGIKKT